MKSLTEKLEAILDGINQEWLKKISEEFMNHEAYDKSKDCIIPDVIPNIIPVNTNEDVEQTLAYIEEVPADIDFTQYVYSNKIQSVSSYSCGLEFKDGLCLTIVDYKFPVQKFLEDILEDEGTDALIAYLKVFNGEINKKVLLAEKYIGVEKSRVLPFIKGLKKLCEKINDRFSIEIDLSYTIFKKNLQSGKLVWNLQQTELINLFILLQDIGYFVPGDSDFPQIGDRLFWGLKDKSTKPMELTTFGKAYYRTRAEFIKGESKMLDKLKNDFLEYIAKNPIKKQ